MHIEKTANHSRFDFSVKNAKPFLIIFIDTFAKDIPMEANTKQNKVNMI